MRLAREIGAALRLLVVPAREADAEIALAALAWVSLAGFGIGGTAALAGVAAGWSDDRTAAIVAVAVLALAQWRLRAPLPRVARAAAVALQLLAVASLSGPARIVPLVLAPGLAAWAMVVQCYGGRGRGGGDAWAPLVGRARFREFGCASASAVGGALVALDAVGLVVAIVGAGVAVGARASAHRHQGGMSSRGVVATGLVVETVTLVVLASLGRLLGSER